MRKWLSSLAFCLVLALIISTSGCDFLEQLTPSPTPTTPVNTPTITSTPSPTQTGSVEARVVRVVDGDTIEVDINGAAYKVRYIGMDTPETVNPSEPIECFGKEASNKNKELVEGKVVRLEKDVSETDRYGRLLRYVWVGDVMVNAELVRLGYAQVATYPPDVKYQDLFLQLQRDARADGLGFWSECASAPTPTNSP